MASCYAVLDAQLPGGGWPVGALCEILQLHSGQHEWRLILPALVRAELGPVIVLVGTPHVSFGPGLAAGHEQFTIDSYLPNQDAG